MPDDTQTSDALKAENDRLRQRVAELEQTTAELQQWFSTIAEQFRASQEVARLGVWEWDIASQQMNWSDILEPIFGIPPGTFDGRFETFIQCVHPDDRQMVEQRMTQGVYAEEAQSFEYRIVWPDGNIRWIAARSMIASFHEGSPVRMVGTAQDITERKLAEEALRASEERFRRLIEATPVAICITNEHGFFEYVNPSYCRLYHYEPEELIGQSFTVVVPPERRGFANTLHDQFIEDAAEPVGEWEVMNKEGKRLAVMVNAAHLIGRDGRPKKATFVVNITEHKRLEAELKAAWQAAEAATQAKSQFLANMSHEIRTPMNAVIGMTNLLLDTELTADQRDYVETIQVSGDVLLTLISDILDFSKIEAGKLEIENHPFSIYDCVEDAVTLLAPRGHEKGLDVACSIDADLPDSLIGDSTRLRQVLINLLSNAVKFTETGEIVVSVGGEMYLPGESADQEAGHPGGVCHLHITVQDTGIGIPADRVTHIFQSFNQADTSITRKYGGTGLGLAICNRLIELMNGTLWVDSKVGQGTTFHVDLAFPVASLQVPPSLEPHQPHLQGRRVLVVSSSTTSRESLLRYATHWGMLPLAFATATEALSYIYEDEPLDVAVIDVDVTSEEELTLAQAIHSTPSVRSLPLLLWMTLTQRSRINQRNNQTGVVPPTATLLVKPIRPSVLHSALLAIFDPLSSDEQPVSSSDQEQQQAQAIPLRILLAEDNRINQKVALLMLEKLGYRADVAANGQEVLAVLRQQPYDLILMDVQMPEMDGVETTNYIRTFWPVQQQPHIVAMTAHAMQGAREWLLNVGMDDYLSKPVQMPELAAILEYIGQERQRNNRIVSLTRQTTSAEDKEEPVATSMVVSFPILEQLLLLVSGDDPTEARDFITHYLQHIAESQAALCQAFEQGDIETLTRIAHSLKGVSAQFGALNLSLYYKQLEQMGKQNSLQGAAELIDQAAAEYKRVQKTLQSWYPQGEQSKTSGKTNGDGSA